jgi:hypothetical protein
LKKTQRRLQPVPSGFRGRPATHSGSPTASHAWELQARLQDLNERILRWADDTDTPADLVCECVDPQCFSVVTVTPAAYRKLTARGEFLLSPGHVGGLPTVLERVS